jgi:RNA polymerase sigma factor (sigma-70 family)
MTVLYAGAERAAWPRRASADWPCLPLSFAHTSWRMPDVRTQVDNTDASLDDNDLILAFAENKARLTRFIRHRCGDDAVDDLVHELWLKARAVDTPIEKPLAYLYRMADRLVLDSRRGASRLKSRDGDWGYVHNRLSEAMEPPIAERSLLARERLARVETTLRQVGERAALIFRRYRLDGIDQRRISEELGVSISTVEKDLRKTYDALLSLRERLDEE